MAYVPEASPNLQAQRDAANRVSDLPRGNFMFAVHPDEWQVDGQGALVPVVVHLSKDPGNCGVGADGDFTPAELQYRKRGYVLIPHDVLGTDQDYVALYRNKRGKKVHRTIFQEPYDSAGGVTEWMFDDEAWSAFLVFLRKKGIVQQPRPAVVKGLLEAKREVHTHLLRREPSRDQADRHEAWEKKVALVHRQIETLELELERSFETHGRPSSPGRSKVLEMLRNSSAMPDSTTEADEVKRQLGKGKASDGKAADDDDDEPEREEGPPKSRGKGAKG